LKKANNPQSKSKKNERGGKVDRRGPATDEPLDYFGKKAIGRKGQGRRGLTESRKKRMGLNPPPSMGEQTNSQRQGSKSKKAESRNRYKGKERKGEKLRAGCKKGEGSKDTHLKNQNFKGTNIKKRSEKIPMNPRKKKTAGGNPPDPSTGRKVKWDKLKPLILNKSGGMGSGPT